MQGEPLRPPSRIFTLSPEPLKERSPVSSILYELVSASTSREADLRTLSLSFIALAAILSVTFGVLSVFGGIETSEVVSSSG